MLSQEERTAFPGVFQPRRSAALVKKPAALRVKLEPLLAGRLAAWQRLSAGWQEQCLHAFWQEAPAEDRLTHWDQGFPQQDVRFACKFSEEASVAQR